jgi:diguanylate cyclase (GGDEF)-like protein
VRDRLRNVFAKREDPYAGVDLANASRFGGALWFIGAILSAALLPFVDPDDVIGTAGTVVAIAIVALAVLVGARMRSSGADANVDELLFYSYTTLVAIGVLTWVTGGVGSPYEQLLILSIVYACSLHPPRRTAVFLVFALVAFLLPLAYDDHVTNRQVLNMVTEMLVWLLLALVVIFLMVYVRAQRLGLRRAGEQARQQARADPLTGLLNRRAFDEDLAAAITRARGGGEPLSLLVGDLDDFKDFNDRYGHLEGDRVLQAIATSMRSAVRRPDVAYRWGGDEFAVILPQADAPGAELVAERVRAAVAQESGPDGEPLALAVGVAQLDGSGDGAALVAAADAALLRSKGSGPARLPQPRG